MQLSESTTDAEKDRLVAQETRGGTDVIGAGKMTTMTTITTMKSATLSMVPAEGRRTIVALVSASLISLVVWGLVVVLNVH